MTTPLEHFRSDTAEHELTIVHDDETFRHLCFRKPGTGMYWYDIITWPGTLCFRGDMGTWVFARLTDMFEFFRNRPGYINDGYWAEKIVAHDRNGTQEFDHDLYRQYVVSTFWDQRDRLATPHSNRSAPEVWALIRRELLDESGWVAPPTDTTEAHYSLRDFDNGNGTDLFGESWEHDFKGYSFQFIWCLHAIVHGIHRYDEAKKAATA